MRIDTEGSLVITKGEVELLISYVRKALLIPSRNEESEEQCFDEFIQALKTIAGDFNNDPITY